MPVWKGNGFSSTAGSIKGEEDKCPELRGLLPLNLLLTLSIGQAQRKFEIKGTQEFRPGAQPFKAKSQAEKDGEGSEGQSENNQYAFNSHEKMEGLRYGFKGN